MTGVSRREALGALGAAGIGVGAGVLVDRGARSDAVTPSPAGTFAPAGGSGSATVASWAAARGSTYFIGHRGSGDVYPEHSLEGYRAAVEAGAQCLEISVGMTSDGVLFCMHDLTFDRTSTGTGIAATMPATVLRGIRLQAPQLGPAWAAEPRPLVPLLSEVLQALAGRAVLCLEAKDDAAFPAMMALVARFGMQSSVIVKLPFSSARIGPAKAAGYPVFAYFGSETDLTPARIAALATQLDRKRDYLILPSYGKKGLLPSTFVTQAVETGIPTWVYGTHRRSDAAHFFALGCAGVVASSYQYLATSKPIAVTDTWAYGAISPGEMTFDPSSPTYAPVWAGNELHLGAAGIQHFLTLGHFSPLDAAAGTYSILAQASWPTLPANGTDNLTIAFGCTDDRYYEHRQGVGNGYHAIVRADGMLQLYRHQDGRIDGDQLGVSVQGAPPTPGTWMSLRVIVTPQQITFARTDGTGTGTGGATGGATTVVTAKDSSFRGGYLHIGRSSTDGVLAFRSLKVR